jgi:hypothetical protein
MWNEQLGNLISTYPTAILSIVQNDGYPASVRCQVRVDLQDHVIFIDHPPLWARAWRGRAGLLFHQHDERLESLRQLLLLGVLDDGTEGTLSFTVEKFVTGNGRSDSDQMPHASSPLHMLKFFFTGWSQARAYIARRGKPWPPIPYDEIAHSLSEDNAAQGNQRKGAEQR